MPGVVGTLMTNMAVEVALKGRGVAVTRLARGVPAGSFSACSTSMPSMRGMFWSVSTRSKPRVTFGPASIETQKQVPPALPQLSATRNAPSRRAA